MVQITAMLLVVITGAWTGRPSVVGDDCVRETGVCVRVRVRVCASMCVCGERGGCGVLNPLTVYLTSGIQVYVIEIGPA